MEKINPESNENECIFSLLRVNRIRKFIILIKSYYFFIQIYKQKKYHLNWTFVESFKLFILKFNDYILSNNGVYLDEAF